MTPIGHPSTPLYHYPEGFDEAPSQRPQAEEELHEAGILVLISSDRMGAKYVGQEALVEEADYDAKTMTLRVVSTGESLYSVPFNAVSTAQPAKGDQIKIVSGDQYVGALANFVGMDEGECIVKLEEGNKICLVNLPNIRLVRRA